MVDALREAHRVLAPDGVLLDVRPVVEPIVVQVVVAGQAIWAKPVEVFSGPDDIAAADAAMRHALSSGWLIFEAGRAFDFQIDCDSAAELREYVEARKLRGAGIPYEDLELRRRDRQARLRCVRPWMLTVYRKR